MTQTESTPSPSDDTLTTSPSVQASSSRTGDGDDTPKRGRGIHSDSWDLASLDPATWPVLKDPFGTSTFRFTTDRMSMASVPEGELSTTSQTLEDTVAEAQQQNEELHQLCWDVLRLAASLEKVKEAPLSHRDLVEETQRCMQLLRQRLQDVPRQVAAERPVGPVSAARLSYGWSGSCAAIAHPEAIQTRRSFNRELCGCSISFAFSPMHSLHPLHSLHSLHYHLAQPTTGLAFCVGWPRLSGGAARLLTLTSRLACGPRLSSAVALGECDPTALPTMLGPRTRGALPVLRAAIAGPSWH